MPPRSGKYKPKPKSRYGKGKGKYRQQKLSVATVAKIAKKAVVKSAESKAFDYSYGKVELYHNTINLLYRINGQTSMPSQGLGDKNRIGDKIYLTGIDIRMLLGQKQDRPNVTFRVIVFSVKANTAQIAGLNYVNIFDNTTGNCLLDSVNSDECKVIKQYFYKPSTSAMIGFNSGTGVGKEYTRPYHIYVPFKRNITFQWDGSTVPDMRDYYILVMAYDAYGTLVTDNIAYCQLWSKMYFKDV